MPEINIEKEIEILMNKLIITIGNKPCIILVHAHWCGHCKNIRPEWNNMKKNFKTKTNIIEIESNVLEFMKKFNFSDEKKAEKFSNIMNMLIKEVQGYPTIMFIKKSKDSFNIEHYNRGGGTLVQFLESKLVSRKK